MSVPPFEVGDAHIVVDQSQHNTDPVLLSRAQAARMFGVSIDMFKRWQARGRVQCGRWIPAAPGKSGRQRVFPLEELKRLKDELCAQGLVYGEQIPPGFVDRDEAARMFGISPDTLTMWHTSGRVRCGKWMKMPGGARCRIYPLEQLQRLKEQLETSKLPEGYVDVEGACQMFGVTKAAWVIWQRAGKVPRGEWGFSRSNHSCRIYKIDELLRIKEQMRGEQTVYVKGGGANEYHIPDGWLRMQDACKMFGVHRNTWERWEREGLITCGERFTERKLKLYPIEPLRKLLEECGRYEPPYPDPARPAVYRVPLAGERMQRREAIIDAQDLPLVEGRRFHYSDRPGETIGHVQTFNARTSSGLHQIIMGVDAGEYVVSHRNEDPLDCRRENLVVRTRSEKNAKRRKSILYRGEPCTSRFKGVCWDRRSEKWIAHIKKDGKTKYLGRYGDEIAAAEARDEAARELFGEHARLNFPDGIDARLEKEAQNLSDGEDRIAA